MRRWRSTAGSSTRSSRAALPSCCCGCPRCAASASSASSTCSSSSSLGTPPSTTSSSPCSRPPRMPEGTCPTAKSPGGTSLAQSSPRLYHSAQKKKKYILHNP
uniref:Putative secreted protein n=1 Tax=Ixodes ricinus TaxID=34613 RepID=A0A6B0UIF8_IXORI